jgi:hypothetical protein
VHKRSTLPLADGHGVLPEGAFDVRAQADRPLDPDGAVEAILPDRES